MEHEVVRIRADSRERASRLYRELTRREDVFGSAARLATGDYRVQGGVTIERKTARDLNRSVRNGRLFAQVARLKRSEARPVLLIEGLAPPPPPWLRGPLTSLAVMWYLPILWTQDAAESAELLVQIGRQWARDHPRAWLPPWRRARSGDAQRISMVRGLPSVGPELARRLLDRFGSIEAVCAASTKDLETVRGIGRRRARVIRGFLAAP